MELLQLQDLKMTMKFLSIDANMSKQQQGQVLQRDMQPLLQEFLPKSWIPSRIPLAATREQHLQQVRAQLQVPIPPRQTDILPFKRMSTLCCCSNACHFSTGYAASTHLSRNRIKTVSFGSLCCCHRWTRLQFGWEWKQEMQRTRECYTNILLP